MSDATITPDLPASLGIIRDYDDLLSALRTRADALRISRATINALSGLADGYSEKLLAATAPKILGKKSLGPVLEVLGLKLIVAEDPVALAKYEKRRQQRAEHQVRDRMLTIAGVGRRREWLFTSERAKEAAALRMAKLSPEKRQRLARRAARAWVAIGNTPLDHPVAGNGAEPRNDLRVLAESLLNAK